VNCHNGKLDAFYGALKMSAANNNNNNNNNNNLLLTHGIFTTDGIKKKR